MITGIILAVSAAVLAMLLARVNTVAYGVLYISFLPFMTLDPTQGGLQSVDGLASGDNVLFKLAVRAMTAGIIVILAMRRARSVFDVATRPACLPVVVFFVWAILGLPRAQDPWVSFFRLGELGAFFLTGVVLYVEAGRNARKEDVLRWHALALIPLLVTTTAFAIMHPEIAFHESSSGIKRMGHKFMNSNVLGFAGAISVLWGLWSLKERVSRTRSEVFLALAVAGLGAYVLFHARSRTASLVTVGALGVLWFPWPHASETPAQRRGRMKAFGTFMIAAAALAIPFADGIESWFLRGASAEDVASGTGRTGLWVDLLTLQVPEAPLLGAGYLNLSSQGGFFHAGHFWNNAHSTYLFALVATGIPGLLLVLTIVLTPIVCTFRRVVRGDLAERPIWTLAFAYTFLVGAASITGFGVTGYPNVAMLFHYALLPWVTRPQVRPQAALPKPDRNAAATPARAVHGQLAAGGAQ